MNDLIQATFQLYLRSAKSAWIGTRKNWWCALFPVVHTIILGVGTTVFVKLLGPIAGGFAAGLLLAIVIANYLALISASVRAERVLLQEIWPRTVELIGPVISVLFALYLLELLVSMFARDALWLRMAAGISAFVFFNPIPENTYIERGTSFSAFGETLEFMRENWAEWLFPIAVFLVPLGVLYPEIVLQVIGQANLFLGISPILQALFSSALVNLQLGVLVFATVLLFLSYFSMVFRGALFLELQGSTRRKRIYNLRR